MLCLLLNPECKYYSILILNKYINLKKLSIRSFLIKMYLYQNIENSQNKHQILNRIVKSIEKQVKYSDVDNYFLKLIKKQDKLFLIAYENNNSSK